MFLTCGKTSARIPHFNARMASLHRPAALPDRTALARFEALYAECCGASEALAAAEIALWTEALRAPGSACQAQLAQAALQQRAIARSAVQRVRAALEDAGEQPAATSCR